MHDRPENRRTLLKLLAAAMVTGTAWRSAGAAAPSADAVNVRDHGAIGDGVADDTAVLARLLTAGGVVYLPAGTYRISRQIAVTRPVRITGDGAASRIAFSGRHSVFRVRDGDDPTVFVHDVTVDNLAFESPRRGRKRAHAIAAVNVRNLAVRHCSFFGCGGLAVTHKLVALGRYRRWQGSVDLDPAVVAGFAADNRDDLNDGIEFAGNRVEGVEYQVQGVRLDFVRNFRVDGNHIDHGNISWWGGGGRRKEGGAWQHLRRVYGGEITNNYCSYANGGIYGNNGDTIHISGNRCENIVDTGIDLEGCQNCLVENNTVRDCGNFCYSIFYGSRKNVFRNNIGVQTGAATGLNRRLGVKAYGANRGSSLFAFRSGDFGEPGSVDIVIEGNTFEWTSEDGLGRFSYGPASRTVLRRNRLRNVHIVLTRKTSETVVVEDNEITIDLDRSPDTSAALMIRNCAGDEGISVRRNKLLVRATDARGLRPIYINQKDVADDVPVVVADNDIRVEGAALARIVVAVPIGKRHVVMATGNSIPVTVEEPSDEVP